MEREEERPREARAEAEPDPHGDEELVEEESEAAAAEAARIGGVAGDEDLDPAVRPVIEGGGGEAEGFEQAEDDLVEEAGHGDPRHDPAADSFEVEAEADRVPDQHGEADDVTRPED